jgi:adenosylcobinamide-GDP ribazoletransferase
MSHLRHFLIALQFLTRFPLRLAAPAPEEIGRSVPYYPLAGMLLGLIFAVLAAAIALRAPPMLAAALILSFWITVTGGLHLDGLADSADAWACGGDRDRMLTVMKDPHCGPAAISALAAVLIVKFAALTALIATRDWMAIMFAPALARTSPLTVFLTTPYVRQGGLGADMANHLPRTVSAAVAALTLLLAIAAGCTVMWLAWAAALYLLRHMMIRHIGGATGDTIGASVVLTEAATLCAAVFAL